MKRNLVLNVLVLLMFGSILQVSAESKFYMYTNENGEQILVPASDVQVMNTVDTPQPKTDVVLTETKTVTTTNPNNNVITEEKNSIEIMADSVNNVSKTINSVTGAVSGLSNAIGGFNKSFNNFGK